MGFTFSTRSGGGIVGKIIFTTFGLFFAFIGTQFVKQEWNALQETKAMKQWVKAPCSIESSEIRDDGEDFRLDIVFSYEINGHIYRATRYGRSEYLTKETIGEIDQAHKTYTTGKTTHCHYNPANPSDAVLTLPTERSARTSLGLTFIFPAFGLLFAALPWLAGRKRKEPVSSIPSRSVKKARSGKRFLLLFGAIFAVIGLVMLKPLILTPLQKSRAAQSWQMVEAVVISSKVKSHTSDDSTTYSPYIAYRYVMNGEQYLGDQYSFIGGSSSGYESKADIVRQYPAGHTFTVYVNPDNPAESVINRTMSNAKLLVLIPLIFFIVGVVIMVSALRAKKAKLDASQAREHIVILKGTSRAGKAVGITLFTAIWNSVVFVLFTSDAPLFMAVIFGLFGAGMLLASIHAILGIFNPRPEVEITPGDIHPGTSVAMRWRTTGRADRIGQLSVALQCLRITTETSGQGKNRSTRTVKTPLFTKELLQTESQHEITQGTRQFEIPEEQPASEPGKESGIQWQLVFHGNIDRWPDLKQELPFTVYPVDTV